MQYWEIIVSRIRYLCGQRGITYNKLATMSGIRQSTIDNIIHGVSKNPRIKTLHKIAIALSMTPAEFLNFPALNDYSFDDEPDEDEPGL